jgi:gas vesicle protein
MESRQIDKLQGELEDRLDEELSEIKNKINKKIEEVFKHYKNVLSKIEDARKKGESPSVIEKAEDVAKGDLEHEILRMKEYIKKVGGNL